jgi:hypothetical protein
MGERPRSPATTAAHRRAARPTAQSRPPVSQLGLVHPRPRRTAAYPAVSRLRARRAPLPVPAPSPRLRIRETSPRGSPLREASLGTGEGPDSSRRRRGGTRSSSGATSGDLTPAELRLEAAAKLTHVSVDLVRRTRGGLDHPQGGEDLAEAHRLPTRDEQQLKQGPLPRRSQGHLDLAQPRSNTAEKREPHRGDVADGRSARHRLILPPAAGSCRRRNAAMCSSRSLDAHDLGIRPA